MFGPGPKDPAYIWQRRTRPTSGGEGPGLHPAAKDPAYIWQLM